MLLLISPIISHRIQNVNEYNIYTYVFIQLSKIIHMCFSHYIYLYESYMNQHC